MRRFPFIVLIVVAAALIIGGAWFLRQKEMVTQAGSGALSPNILDLTSPVNSFAGTVEKKDGNILTVSEQLASKKLTYLIQVNSATSIDVVNILPGQAVPAVTVENLGVGSSVIVRTNTDLRTLRGNQFSAASILLNMVNNIQGIIGGISGNTLTITIPQPPVPLPEGSNQPKSYQIQVTDNTDITKTISGANPLDLPKQEKGAISDLNKGDRVSIATDSDINTSQNLKALTILVSPTSAAIPK